MPAKFEILSDQNICVTETMQRNIYLSKEEFMKAIKAMQEKLGYFKHQISEQNIARIKNEIKVLEDHISAYKAQMDKFNNNNK